MEDSKPQPREAPAELHRVDVRVPPFYAQRPALWFAQLESQFVLAGITREETKFHYAISQLDPVYAAEVEDIIADSTLTDKYKRLKTELVKRLSASRERKVKQLLTSEELGDRKPSQFLRHLKQLAGPDVPEDFLRTIWSSRLPSGTQTIIASQMKVPLDELAELADRIQDVVVPQPQVAAAAAPSSVDVITSQVAALSRQVEALTEKMEMIARGRDRSRTPGRNRGRSQSSGRSDANYRKYPTCWYHQKFGDDAKKCAPPCDYQGNGPGSR